MKVEFRKCFEKDLKKKARESELRLSIRKTIEQVIEAKSIWDIRNLKKLKAEGNYYRIRLGNYRIGLKIEEDTVVFVRFLHRREIYRYFP